MSRRVLTILAAALIVAVSGSSSAEVERRDLDQATRLTSGEPTGPATEDDSWAALEIELMEELARQEFESVQFPQNRMTGQVRMGCEQPSTTIWSQQLGLCPPVAIAVSNTGNCRMEVVFTCAGAEMARFGPTRGRRVMQCHQADTITVTCNETGTACRGNWVLRW